MKKRISVVTVAVLLTGLLFVSLPGISLTQVGTQTPGQEQYQQAQPGYGYQAQARGELPSLFLQALADKLGISVEELEQAIQAAKGEVIEGRLGEAVRAERIAPERARELKERLSQAGPRELMSFMMGRSKARGQMEQIGQRRAPFGEELKRGRLIGPRWQQPQPQPNYGYMPPYYPPYYQPYPYNYNCVCYCNFPGWYFAPTPIQPQPLMPWKLQQPQPQGPGPQTPQNP